MEAKVVYGYALKRLFWHSICVTRTQFMMSYKDYYEVFINIPLLAC